MKNKPHPVAQEIAEKRKSLMERILKKKQVISGILNKPKRKK